MALMEKTVAVQQDLEAQGFVVEGVFINKDNDVQAHLLHARNKQKSTELREWPSVDGYFLEEVYVTHEGQLLNLVFTLKDRCKTPEDLATKWGA